jgi:hypothetical protein
MGWPKGVARKPQGAAAMPPLSISEPQQEAAMAEPKTPVKLLYDFWLEEDARIEAGTVIDLPVAEAKRLIASGKAERADAFPGE